MITKDPIKASFVGSALVVNKFTFVMDTGGFRISFLEEEPNSKFINFRTAVYMTKDNVKELAGMLAAAIKGMPE